MNANGLCWFRLGACAIVALAVIGRAARADETLAARRARVNKMDAHEREQLSQNYERFMNLDSEDQDRLRSLHADLEAAPDRDELRQVMQNYHDWLNALPANQRMTLAALPDEERLKRIDQIRAFQTKQKHRASPQDLQAIVAWARKHEVQRKWTEAKRNNTTTEVVSAQDLAELRETLSDEAKQALDDAHTPESIRQQLMAWLVQFRRQGGAGGSRGGFRGPSDEELRTFLKAELSDAERSYLSAFPPERMQFELRQLWRAKHAKPGDAPRDRTEGRPFGPGRQRAAQVPPPDNT
jgi:hypothetical protein